MKRFIALLLTFCLMVSALSVSAFAADDAITGKDWSCITAGKSVEVSSDSSASNIIDVLHVTSASEFNTREDCRYSWDYPISISDGDETILYKVDTRTDGNLGIFRSINGRAYTSFMSLSSMVSVSKCDVIYDEQYSRFTIRILGVSSEGRFVTTATSPMKSNGSYFPSSSVVCFATDDSSSSPVSSSISYIFDASFSTASGFGTSPIEDIYESFPGWSGISRNTAALFELPASTSIFSSVTVSVDGFSGFGSENTMPHGSLKIYSVDTNGKAKDLLISFSAISPTVSGNSYLFSYSSAFSLLKTVNTYAASLFYVFTLEGSEDCSLGGHTITCTVNGSNIYVKTLAPAVSDTDKSIEETTKDIYETVISNNAEVIAKLTSIYNRLKEIGLDTSSMKSMMQEIVTAINSLGTDLDSVLSYLQNMVSQVTRLADLVQTVSDKLQVNTETLTSILTELVSVGAGVDLCVTYLTGINSSLDALGGTVEEMRGYVEASKQTLLDILSEMQTFNAATRSILDDVLKNLISQGADLSGMKSYLATIKQNGTEANELLRDLLEELQKVEAANTETNDRLDSIRKALDDFEVNLNQTVNNVMSETDKKGLSGLISKIVNRLLSVVDFIGDLFGDVFTSIPSTISAFNDCNSFWEDSRTYVYTPHQLSGYTGQGGAGYENSNSSVQSLFTEAEKYLGYPYVFGGSSPETSFDCSGFVCYALNHSGVYTIDRTSAQGLFDTCTKISESEAKPGDLVFFTGTVHITAVRLSRTSAFTLVTGKCFTVEIQSSMNQ